MDYVRDTDADPRQEETIFSNKSAGLGKTDAWKGGNALIPKLGRKVEGASGRPHKTIGIPWSLSRLLPPAVIIAALGYGGPSDRQGHFKGT